MIPVPVLTPPLAVLLDMDGTLTTPLLDFAQIKREMGIKTGGILETLAKMPAADRPAAEAILLDHEDRAARASTLNAGCVELLKWLDEVNIKRAVVTRNTRRSVATVFDLHGLHFDVCVTREDGRYKPDPAPLLLACDRLKVPVDRAWMVGDGNHDIEAGVNANMTTVWVHHGHEKMFAAAPTAAVRDLPELLQLLKTQAANRV